MKLDFANFVKEFQKRLSIRVIIAFRFEFLLDQTNQTYFGCANNHQNNGRKKLMRGLERVVRSGKMIKSPR